MQIISKSFFAKFMQSVSKKLKNIKIWKLKVGQNKDLVSSAGKSSTSGSVLEDSGS